MTLSKPPKSFAARASAIVLALAASAMLPPAVNAQSQPPAPQEDRPGALARDAIEKMMRALSLAIENLPQYAPPEFNENGDIIIRRLNPRAEKPRQRVPENPDETRT